MSKFQKCWALHFPSCITLILLTIYNIFYKSHQTQCHHQCKCTDLNYPGCLLRKCNCLCSTWWVAGCGERDSAVQSIQSHRHLRIPITRLHSPQVPLLNRYRSFVPQCGNKDVGWRKAIRKQGPGWTNEKQSELCLYWWWCCWWYSKSIDDYRVVVLKSTRDVTS